MLLADLSKELDKIKIILYVLTLQCLEGPDEAEGMAEEAMSAEGSHPKGQVADLQHVQATKGEDLIDYEQLISTC